MTQIVKNIYEQIDQRYYELTAAERKAADFVMRRRSDVQFLSIGEFAEQSGVAEATITRFCRRLGCAGYSAFKLAVANAGLSLRGGAPSQGRGGESDDSLEGVSRRLLASDADAMQKTMELLRPETLDRAVQILTRAKKVLCMGLGGSMIMASEAAHLFSTISGKFIPVSDAHLQVVAASTLLEGDAVLYFSYSGATKDMEDTLRAAREQNALVILVTRFPRAPGAALADLVLQCGATESPLEMGSVAARIAQLYLLDVLFTRYCMQDPAGYAAVRNRIATALTDKHL